MRFVYPGDFGITTGKLPILILSHRTRAKALSAWARSSPTTAVLLVSLRHPRILASHAVVGGYIADGVYCYLGALTLKSVRSLSCLVVAVYTCAIPVSLSYIKHPGQPGTTTSLNFTFPAPFTPLLQKLEESLRPITAAIRGTAHSCETNFGP